MKGSFSRALGAVLRRDLLEAASYRTATLGRLLALIGFVVSAHFLARTFSGHEPPAIRGGYYAFLLSGVGLAELAWSLLVGPADRMRRAQLSGTLEATWAAGLRGTRLLVVEAVAGALAALLRVAVIAGVGALFIEDGLLFDAQVVAGLAGLVALTAAAMLPIGLAGAALTVLLHRGDPLGRAAYAGTMLASGVAYPTAVLPGWLSTLAESLAATPALRALRGVALESAGWAQVAPDVLQLGILAALATALAAPVIHFSLRAARRQGRLGQY